MRTMTKLERPDIYDASIPGCKLELPLLDAKDYQKVCYMVDNPTEYSVEELAMALDEILLCLEKAESFIVSMHKWLIRMQGIWKRWIHIIKPGE